MSKPWHPNRRAVDLQSSKIRREPPPLPSDKPTMLRMPTQDDSWAVILGVMAFAVAITYLIFWISDYTSPSREEQAITITDAS